MAVDPGAAVAGHMFHHRQDAAFHQAVRLGPAKADDDVWVGEKGPVADGLVAA